MRSTTQRGAGGKHRKVTPTQTAKSRIAFTAIAASAVASAGAGGAAAAQLASSTDGSGAESSSIQLANDASSLPALGSSAAPQILPIAEYKPVNSLSSQLDKAVRATAERVAADIAARLPNLSLPAEGSFTSGFGMRWGSLHGGIDIANVNGTPILAVMDGEVIDAGPADGYGNWVRIRHDNGMMSVYGHMDTVDVQVGDRVHAGQKIAGMGNLGFSTGTHLHFEIHPTETSGPIDPLQWFAENGLEFPW